MSSPAWLSVLPILLAACASTNGSSTNASIHDGGHDGGDATAPPSNGHDAGDGSVSTGGEDARGPGGALVSADYQESTEDFPNPERGFHGNFDLGSDPSVVRAAGHSLARLYVRLDDFRAQPISTVKLAAIQGALDAVRAAGIAVIVRFTYNFPTTYPNGDQDASESQILAHIAQLSPLLASNADVIAVLQAGFIGNWGEWHDSTNGLDNDTSAQSAIVSALLNALPSSRSIQLRYPNHLTSIFGDPLTAADAFGGSPKSRAGLHDDCFLASDDDMGTYGRTGTGVGASPAAGKAFLAAIGQYVPIGGETCAVDSPRSDCATATSELAMMHYSYMNADFEPSVLANWKSGGCYGDISKRLGYRLFLKKASHTASVVAGGKLEIHAVVSNDGYAPLFNPRPIALVLSGAGQTRTIPLAVDPRRFAPSSDVPIDETVTVPTDLSPGVYSIALALPNADSRLSGRPEYAVRFANDGVWNASSGTNVLTTTVTLTP